MVHNEEDEASYLVHVGALSEDVTIPCHQPETDEEFYVYHAFPYTSDYSAPRSHKLAAVGV